MATISSPVAVTAQVSKSPAAEKYSANCRKAHPIILKGDEAVESGRYADAEKLYLSALAIEPRMPEAQLALAEA